MKYSQMSFDVSLESERELKDNVMMAVEFACKQVDQEARKQVESRHEGYGIAAERMNALSNSMKVVGDSMKRFLRILPAAAARRLRGKNTHFHIPTRPRSASDRPPPRAMQN